MSDAPRKGWFSRLREGLTRSTERLTQSIASVVTRRRLDDEALEELEEALIAADLGPATASRLIAALRRARFGREVTDEEVRAVLAAEAEAILTPVALSLPIDRRRRPHVLLVVGVNGAGKTTTIGKLARFLSAEGLSVMLAAGDTFRAAAVEQLKVWGERSGVPVLSKPTGADPAALAYEALEQGRREQRDLLMIDTAGRLHNKANLMAELQKIVRVLKKLDPEAPHGTLLVLDATTGQNALNQVEVFLQLVQVTGLVVTKLDGSAKGGVLVALADRFRLPVHMVGVGEGPDDLRPFDPRQFSRSLLGLPEG